MRPPARPRRRIVLSVTVTAALGTLALTAWLLRPTPNHSQAIPYTPQTRARTYTAYTACLLTDQGGTTSAPAAAVWTGMQAASNTTHAQISFLTMQGPDTPANAEVYINTLALRGCSLILAVGQAPTQGARDRASAFPGLLFMILAAPAATTASGQAPNLTSVAAADPAAIRAETQNQVARAANQVTTR